MLREREKKKTTAVKKTHSIKYKYYSHFSPHSNFASSKYFPIYTSIRLNLFGSFCFSTKSLQEEKMECANIIMDANLSIETKK